ncbi:MAG TPA: LPS export ABC transporter permease LptF [Hyphomicrobiaceae bacterium]|nr:LPS export ABC transporter permease LptF [Hyphomicrobiaceae bacterium]
MTIFGRYVFRQTAGALLLILISLAGVVWIGLALRQLNLVTTQGQDTWTFVKMTTLALPNLMALIAPVALLIAMLHTLNRLNGDSELIVMTAAGASPWRVGRPLLLLALLVAVAVALVNHFAMPWSMRLLRDYVIKVRTDLIAQVLQPGRFSSPERDLTFHIRDRAMNGELLGVLLHDARDPKQVTSYLAERGGVRSEGELSFLVLAKGHVLRRTGPDEPSQIIAFDTYAVDLVQFQTKGEHYGLKPRERYFSELAFPDPDDADFKRNAGHFRAELHERFSNPFYPFAFVLIVMALVGRAQSNRRGRVEAVITAFVLAMACRLVGLAAHNVVVLDAAAVPLLYAIPLVAGALAVLFIRLGARPGRGPDLGERLLPALEPLKRLIPALSRATSRSEAPARP